MKARFCIGFSAIILLLMLGAGSVRTAQVNAADLQSAPREAWLSEYISTDPDAGSHVSIAFDEEHGNHPWIAYYDETNESLMVSHFTGGGNGNCAANDDWLCDEVDTGGVGQYNSIDVFPDTNPDPFQSTWKVGVSYFDATNRSLKFAQYTCPSFICAWSIETVQAPFDATDPSDSVGKYSSLEFGPDGRGHISYYRSVPVNDFINVWLVYARQYLDGGWSHVDIDGDSDDGIMDFGTYSSLDLDYQGYVWISYYDSRNGDLLLAYCDAGSNCVFYDEWDKWVIDDGGDDDTGLFTSLYAPRRSEQVTSIAYYNKTAGELRYAFYLGTSGNCGPGDAWWCSTIDTIGADLALAGISLAVNDLGSPLIAYMDGSGGLAPSGLKVASPAYFQTYANCGSGYYSWYCREVDNGGAYQEEAEFAALGVKPNGLAMIAYAERDTYAFPEEYNLKFAYQVATTLLPLVVK